MRVFGFEVSVRKAAVGRTFTGWEPANMEGAWLTLFDSSVDPTFRFQRDLHVRPERAQAHWAVFACQTLIASDIGKLGVKLTSYNATTQVYEEVDSPSVSPFLRQPNGYQTWQEFVEQWILSKVSSGNAYILMQRDNSNDVTDAYVLDPWRVTPLVSDSGMVFYRLGENRLAQITDGDLVVPASEIMHDRMYCLFHPLIGVSPLFACALPATQGLDIQSQSTHFFRNASVPSGILVTPQRLDDKLAADYQKRWEQNYGGKQRGRTAVLGNGLEYKALTQSAVDSQLVDQLKLTAEMVCTTYHVPPYKIGVGATPTYQNAEVLNQIYYSDCVQAFVQKVEGALNAGLKLPQKNFRVCLDEDDLLRMDKLTQMEFVARGVEKAIFAPNEGRRRFNLPPVTGGDDPLLQQQNFSLAALAKRDNLPNPFVIDRPTVNPTPSAEGAPVAADPNAAKSALAEAAAMLRASNPHARTLRVVNG